MVHYPYLNYTKIFEDYAQHFELALIYHPQSGRANLAQLKEASDAALKSTGAMPLYLPLAFRLMVAGHLEILISKEFGELSSHTFLGKKGTRKMQIQVGASYQEYIQSEELALIHDWCDRVMYDWGHQPCQRSLKRPH